MDYPRYDNQQPPPGSWQQYPGPPPPPQGPPQPQQTPQQQQQQQQQQMLQPQQSQQQQQQPPPPPPQTQQQQSQQQQQQQPPPPPQGPQQGPPTSQQQQQPQAASMYPPPPPHQQQVWGMHPSAHHPQWVPQHPGYPPPPTHPGQHAQMHPQSHPMMQQPGQPPMQGPQHGHPHQPHPPHHPQQPYYHQPHQPYYPHPQHPQQPYGGHPQPHPSQTHPMMHQPHPQQPQQPHPSQVQGHPPYYPHPPQHHHPQAPHWYPQPPPHNVYPQHGPPTVAQHPSQPQHPNHPQHMIPSHPQQHPQQLPHRPPHMPPQYYHPHPSQQPGPPMQPHHPHHQQPPPPQPPQSMVGPHPPQVISSPHPPGPPPVGPPPPPPPHQVVSMPQQQPPPPQILPQPQPQTLPTPPPSHHSRSQTPQHPQPCHTPTRPIQQTPTHPAQPSPAPKIEKKEITFPKNSVEATKPVATKKRKMTSKDVTDIEIWRLLMCLKSGLLAESSWSIDVLSILLNDDSTLMSFGLKQLPGFLEAILEHFKCCLDEIFDGIVKDTTLKPMIHRHSSSLLEKMETSNQYNAPVATVVIKQENGIKTNDQNKNSEDKSTCNKSTKNSNKDNSINTTNNNNTINNNTINVNDNIGTNNRTNNSKTNTKTNGKKDENSNRASSKNVIITTTTNKSGKRLNGIVNNNSSVIIPKLDDQTVMFATSMNYTFRTRDGKIVKLKSEVNHVQDEPSYELEFKPVGYSHWQEGNGEDTSHIQTSFEPKNFIESSRRCTCLSTILRNLSFIPGNDVEMSRHAGLLLVLGRLLLLKHNDTTVHMNEAMDSAPNEWHLLNSLREDTLVIISNISSSLDLSPYNDKINLSLLDGLLHWACCSSSYALDLFPAPSMTVSPQRLALESLAKLSIIEGNVDLILATPPWTRIEKLFEVLASLLNANEDQTIREFSLVLLSNLTAADSGIARKVALTGSAIPKLLSFLETSLTDPETFATTLDMLRRAASTLKCLSQLVDNHQLFSQHQQRLLNLVMSPKLDQEVVPIIADVIFEISLSH